MTAYDYHVHSTFSDGQHPLAEVAEAACARGMKVLGFSDHGYAPYDTDNCMRREDIPRYRDACKSVITE